MELQDFGGFGFGVWTFGDSEFSFFDELCVS